MKRDWKKCRVGPEEPLRKAMEVMSSGNAQICLVAESDGKLLGTITDGDIRRAILNNLGMSTPSKEIMNSTPLSAGPRDTYEDMMRLMHNAHINSLPILDDKGGITSLVRLDDLIRPHAQHQNWIVLMAGGLGSRLHPLTHEMPKPLLPVGNKPLLETIIGNFLNQNFNRFYISVNFKARMIQDYFGDGSKWGAEIRYLIEDEPMGTAGGLRLIEERPTDPLIIMNADLLTQVNSQYLLDFHHQEEACATMCVREYDFQVPFGVVEIEDQSIKTIDEKPLKRVFVNAGIYVLNPEMLDMIPKDGAFDMPALFDKALGAGHRVPVFPIREYWLDIGRHDDLEKARQEFDTVFGS